MPNTTESDTKAIPATVGQAATEEFLLAAELLEPMALDTFLVQAGEREYVLKRTGECDSTECGAPCCNMICLGGDYSEYLEGFADKGRMSPVFRKRCSFLGDDALCTRWRKDNYPLPCLLFPVPGDRLFLEVIGSCTYTFIIEADVTNMRERGAGFYEGQNGD